MNTTIRPRNLTMLAFACAPALLGGCGLFQDSGPGGALAIVSRDGSTTFSPTFVTTAYAQRDENSADIFLSDMPVEHLTSSAPADARPGTLLHINVFLIPSAGNTPIDATACNVTIRQLVVAAPGQVGLYAGGGFLHVSGRPGDETFGGSMDGASQRLARSTQGFIDPLGSCRLSGEFRSRKDESLAFAMRARVAELERLLPRPAVEASPDQSIEEPDDAE